MGSGWFGAVGLGAREAPKCRGREHGQRAACPLHGCLAPGKFVLQIRMFQRHPLPDCLLRACDPSALWSRGAGLTRGHSPRACWPVLPREKRGWGGLPGGSQQRLCACRTEAPPPREAGPPPALPTVPWDKIGFPWHLPGICRAVLVVTCKSSARGRSLEPTVPGTICKAEGCLANKDGAAPWRLDRGSLHQAHPRHWGSRGRCSRGPSLAVSPPE